MPRPSAHRRPDVPSVAVLCGVHPCVRSRPRTVRAEVTPHSPLTGAPRYSVTRDNAVHRPRGPCSVPAAPVPAARSLRVQAEPRPPEVLAGAAPPPFPTACRPSPAALRASLGSSLFGRPRFGQPVVVLLAFSSERAKGFTGACLRGCGRATSASECRAPAGPQPGGGGARGAEGQPSPRRGDCVPPHCPAVLGAVWRGVQGHQQTLGLPSPLSPLFFLENPKITDGSCCCPLSYLTLKTVCIFQNQQLRLYNTHLKESGGHVEK